MDFTIRILGSGSAIPTLSRGCSSQFITCKQRHILIDCGEGTQLQMRKFKIRFQRLQIILISHLHGDHILGLTGLIGTMQLLGHEKPLKIIGPKGVRDFVLSQFRVVNLDTGFPIEFIELPLKTEQIVYEDKCIVIRTFPLNHRIPCQGYRIDEKPGKRRLIKEEFDKTGVSFAYIEKLLSGEDIIDNNDTKVNFLDVTLPPKPTKSYAYCSDTCYFEPILPAIENVDLLYHEATFIEKEKHRAKATFHSTAKQAGSIAKQAKAKRLILGHFSARYKQMDEHLSEAKTEFEKVFIANDGELFVV